MLDGLATLAHGERVRIKALLHSIEQMLVLTQACGPLHVSDMPTGGVLHRPSRIDGVETELRMRICVVLLRGDYSFVLSPAASSVTK
ncbi:hypothetical protein SAMN05444321_0032 [Bradyrhizobium lablabi]|nr:hypothetical protein SAMN05444321_0032 [Bradyrhizobium lablabi]